MKNLERILVSREVPDDARREIKRLYEEEVGFCNDDLLNYVSGGVLDDCDDGDIAEICRLRDGDIDLVFDQLGRSQERER